MYSNTVWKTRGFERPNYSKTIFQLYLQAGTRGLAEIANPTIKARFSLTLTEKAQTEEIYNKKDDCNESNNEENVVL